MHRQGRIFVLVLISVLLVIPAASWAEDSGGFEFHGYMRAGFDFNTKLANPESGDLRLSQMATDAHSRFGNEGNRSYFEPSFQYTWKDDTSDDFWKVVLAFSTFYNEGANDDGDTDFNNREAYVLGKGFDFAPDMKVWVGNRYYGREYLGELDWFFTNLIGYGAGVEDISLGPGKLNVAWIAVHHGLGAWEANNLLYEDDDFSEKVGELQENNFDFSFHSIPLTDKASLKLELNLKYIKGGNIELPVYEADGETIDYYFNGEVEDHLGYYFLTGIDLKNIGRFYGMYLNGAAASKGPGGWSDSFHRDIDRDLDVDDFTPDPSDSTRGVIDFDDRYQYRFIYSGQFTGDRWGIAPYLVYDYYTNDQSGDDLDERSWFDIGFRTNYAFSDLVSVILDVDYAYQIRSEGVAGGDEETTPSMLKITPAIALSAGKFLWSRPTIRFYATYGYWNDDAKGDLSDIAYEVDDSDYLKFGIQCEAWW